MNEVPASAQKAKEFPSPPADKTGAAAFAGVKTTTFCAHKLQREPERIDESLKRKPAPPFSAGETVDLPPPLAAEMASDVLPLQPAVDETEDPPPPPAADRTSDVLQLPLDAAK